MMEGEVEEYSGRAQVEDESVLGSSDKMVFYAKEMVADLTRKTKRFLNPFIVAKLDLNSIKFFEFPKQPIEENRYLIRKDASNHGAQYLIECEKRAIASTAKAKVETTDYDLAIAELIKDKEEKDEIATRNITVPSMLSLFCNMMELHRLRNEIILAASECEILQQAYVSQCEFANFR
jgi:hypothetical protein